MAQLRCKVATNMATFHTQLNQCFIGHYRRTYPVEPYARRDDTLTGVDRAGGESRNVVKRERHVEGRPQYGKYPANELHLIAQKRRKHASNQVRLQAGDD